MEPDVRCPIKSIEFIPFTKQEIENFSIMPVTNPAVFDKAGVAVADGVYDNKLGPTESNQQCPICGQHSWNCPGHFGHISLCKPVYHPLYVKQLARLLGGFCSNCNSLRIHKQIVMNVMNALDLVERGITIEDDIFSLLDPESDPKSSEKYSQILELIKNTPIIEPNSYTVRTREAIIKEFLNRASSHRLNCANCHFDNQKLKFDSFRFEFQVVPSDKTVTPYHVGIDIVRQHLNNFYGEYKPFFDRFFNATGPDMFFIDTVCVTPPKFRPMSVLGDKINAHPTSSALVEVIRSDNNLKSLIEKGEPNAIRAEYNKLQSNVNSLFDSALSKSSKKVPNGIRQVLEKKEGLFRKNLMGKRVNYSARSVIAPDPYVATDEVGVPEVFAKTLSYPERVTDFNKERLSEAVMNGPDVYPGANYVIDCNGQQFSLKSMKEGKRKGLAKMLFAPPDGPMPWTVGRHMINGDYVLINRQPTLHRVSILAMKSRVLPNQRTIRMHYANCASFNADFDGDEINLHLPQSELARSEAFYLSLSSRHYITPTAGNPIRGLIQDNVDSGAILTLKNKFFSLKYYQELVFAAFSGESTLQLEMVPPAIIYPQQLWTGKQIISTILINITRGKSKLRMTSNSKFTNVLFSSMPEETTVRIFDGLLVHGVIDKAQYGASAYGLVHCLYELYGSDLAGRFLTMLTRLFTFYMQTHGFSCGIDDMGISKSAEESRKQMAEDTIKESQKVMSSFVQEFGSRDDTHESLLIRLWNIIKNPDMKERFDHVTMGALNKISTKLINTVFPKQLTKPFPTNSMIMMTQSGAKGSIVNTTQISCLLGQQSLEGKRVPIMSSGKTLPSFGFMDLSPKATGFVNSRFITGLTPQEYFFHAMAGREGLTDTAVKTANTGYLQRCIIKNIEGLHAAYDGTVRDSDDTIIQFLYGEDGIDPLSSKFISKFDFIDNNNEAYIEKLNIEEVTKHAECEKAMKMLDEKSRAAPIQSYYPPHKHVGSISESFEKSLNTYCQNNNLENEEKLRALALFNYFKSIVQPGEVVGVIAAQAIGEPATQMTLNTFHLAGYGGTNVTLGIPRLREILIIATKTPMTPMMKLPLVMKDVSEAKKFLTEFKRTPLRDVVDSYTVREEIIPKTDVRCERRIVVSLKLAPERFPVTTKSFENAIDMLQTKFSKLLKKKLGAVFKSSGTKITEIAVDEAPSNQTGGNDEREEEMGADETKRKSRKNEQNSYEARDEPTANDNNQDNQQDKEENDEEHDENVMSHYDKTNQTMTISFAVSNVSLKILFESIVEDVLNEVMVHEIKGVKRATLEDPLASGAQLIVTEGSNYEEVVRRPEIDMNRFYSNDIALMLKRYGIEAARTAVIKEVSSVFDAYGISIDKRHLQLIADYVTNSGEWLGMSRHTMKKCSSPMQQMSFETTTQFLTHASMHGSIDMAKSPSASLAVGNLVNFGTGLCDILVPFE